MQILKNEKKNAILECASDIFFHKGYEKTTMRQIAKEANISVGNIYRYFLNKEVILREIMSPLEEELKLQLDKLQRDMFADQSNKKCIEFIENLIATARNHHMMISVLFSNLNHESFKKYKHMIVENVKTKILLAAKYFQNYKIDYIVAEAVVVAMLEGVASIIKNEKFNETKGDQTRIFLTMYLTSLVSKIEEG